MMRSSIYVLNPDYVLKNDVSRIILRSEINIDSEISSPCRSFIHPVQAMIFSFFTYKRELGENIKLLSYFLDVKEQDVLEMITPFIDNEEKITTIFEGNRIKIPKNLIINIDRLKSEYIPLQIDLETLRCKSVDIKSKRNNTGPSQITFMLTNRCVTQCCYCYANTNKKVEYPISTQRILEIIREAKDLDLYNVNLIGGEVFLHKDWDIILKEAYRLGFSPFNISTKVPITSQIVDKLKRVGYKSILQLSLDSMNAGILQKTLHVSSNYINEVKNGIQILEDCNIKYRIETVITKYNSMTDQIDNLYKYLLTLNGVVQWEIRLAMYSNYKDNKNFLNIRSDKDAIKELGDYIVENIKNKAPFEVQLPLLDLLNKDYFMSDKGSSSFHGARCSALCDHMFILPDGKVTICEQLYWNENFIIGDLNQNSLLEVWNSPKALALANIERENLQEKSACRSCEHFEQCFHVDRNRCWSDIIKAYGTDCWDFPDPRCKKAPQMLNSLEY